MIGMVCFSLVELPTRGRENTRKMCGERWAIVEKWEGKGREDMMEEIFSRGRGHGIERGKWLIYCAPHSVGCSSNRRRRKETGKDHGTNEACRRDPAEEGRDQERWHFWRSWWKFIMDGN